MAGVKGIVGAFASFGKAAESLVLTDGLEVLEATGQELVGVALVANIPYELVVWGVKDIMDGQGQLNNAQAGCEMASDLGNGRDYFTADVGSQLGQALFGKSFEIGGGVD